MARFSDANQRSTGRTAGVVRIALLTSAITLAGSSAPAFASMMAATPSSLLPNRSAPIDTKDTAKFVTALAASTAAPLGIKTGKATCPAKVTAKASAITRFQCTVPYEGILAPYVVSFDTATAKFDVQPGMAILSTAKLVEFVRSNVDAVTAVECGKAKVLVRPPLSTVACAVKAGRRSATVTIRVDDTKGAVTILSAQ